MYEDECWYCQPRDPLPDQRGDRFGTHIIKRAGGGWRVRPVGPALCQRSCRPGKAPGTRLSAGASGRFARGTAH